MSNIDTKNYKISHNLNFQMFHGFRLKTAFIDIIV